MGHLCGLDTIVGNKDQPTGNLSDDLLAMPPREFSLTVIPGIACRPARGGLRAVSVPWKIMTAKISTQGTTRSEPFGPKNVRARAWVTVGSVLVSTVNSCSTFQS